jgi:hypothetical protein
VCLPETSSQVKRFVDEVAPPTRIADFRRIEGM